MGCNVAADKLLRIRSISVEHRLSLSLSRWGVCGGVSGVLDKGYSVVAYGGVLWIDVAALWSERPRSVVVAWVGCRGCHWAEE